ncbi:MAG: hypothetical protein VX518_02505 [Candidatus Thermoplasmatota archaeon]|jgi:hypothetical protein|nr:hypothetical protein [Candidatus Thermoplasmatota archaeon]MEC7483597.1 hypothetical protein [Candidatus Thermoplasmatota archaeon]MEC7635889.1 hypothetical protein [Candidatus Thermoplasmatota archaeon]MEC8340376.1 hypothetical protein [Candidatus Thermoplasmatota archaeon]MEC9211311.1 hypothetical protein [Candidatus Thermoplasmatota archaeon]
MTNDNQGVDLTGLREVLDDSITNKISAVMLSSLVLLLVINAFDLMSNNDDVRVILDGNTNWEITFDEMVVTQTDSLVVADGDTESRIFSVDESMIDDDYRIGAFRITVSYTETSGIPGDPADSVFATLVQNDMMAQWDEDGNELAGSSNDASPIDLSLMAYPAYTGEAINATGYNEIQVLDAWVMDGYGIGDVEIEISVETQALPFTADNEEEVTITLDVIAFKAVAQQ